MPTGTLEERLTAVEEELAQLKRQLTKASPPRIVPWWEQISGVFKDNAAFEEAVRLGREWRESQRMEYDDDADAVEEGLGSA